MKFKLDENLGRAAAAVLLEAGLPLPGPDGRLWIVQPGSIRLYQGGEADDR